MGVGAGAGTGCKAGHGVGQNISAGQLKTIHRPSSYDERLRRIQSAGYADNDLLDACGSQTLHQTMHLDVVRLVGLFIASHCVAGNEGEALNLAMQTVGAARYAVRLTAGGHVR